MLHNERLKSNMFKSGCFNWFIFLHLMLFFNMAPPLSFCIYCTEYLWYSSTFFLSPRGWFNISPELNVDYLREEDVQIGAKEQQQRTDSLWSEGVSVWFYLALISFFNMNKSITNHISMKMNHSPQLASGRRTSSLLPEPSPSPPWPLPFTSLHFTSENLCW